MVGIEPTTYGLRNRCSTAELHWLFALKRAIQAASFADYRLDCMLNFCTGQVFSVTKTN